MENYSYLNYDNIEEIQSGIETNSMSYIRNMVMYVLNPQGKLPPKLKENNLGFIFASSLPNLAAKPDFETGVVTVDKQEVMDKYEQVQNLFNEGYKPDNNLTYYPLHMIQPTNSSKFIHGLPYIEIINKWENDFNSDPEGLRDFIKSYSKKLHIDDDIEIVSALVVGRSIHLRIRNNDFDVTLPLGYSTKHETFSGTNDEIIELVDCLGNIFSPKGFDKIDYLYSDEEIKENVEKAHEQKSKYMINFYPWRGPEYVTEKNYKRFYYHEVEDKNMSDEEALANFSGILHHFKSGKRVIIEQVNDKNGNYLATTQDQILPNYGKKHGNDEEKENYNYWKNTYKKELYRLIDLGVDCFRIDLAHGFRKNNDCDLLDSLIHNAVEYTRSEYNKNIYFVLETYDFSFYGGTKPAYFRDRNVNLPYPAVKVYHKEIEDKLAGLREWEGLDNFMGDLQWLFQDMRGVFGEMAAFATFDDYNLKMISQRSGIDHKYILEMLVLLGKAGFNVLSLDRDFLGEEGEMIPTVPGGSEEYFGSGKYKTHKFLSGEEFIKHLEKDILEIYRESDSMEVLKNVSNYPEVKGISIDKGGKKLIFIFKDNSRRVFDFQSMIDGDAPEILPGDYKPKKLDQRVLNDLEKIKSFEANLIKKYKNFVLDSTIDDHLNEKLHIYNYDFWIELVNYIRSHAWDEYGIGGWDIFKQEAYFLLNKDRLISDFLSYKEIKLNDDNKIGYLIDSDEQDTLNEINVLKKSLKQEVIRILEKSYKDKYPDLFEEQEELVMEY